MRSLPYDAQFALCNIGGNARVIRRDAPEASPMPTEEFIRLRGREAGLARRWLRGVPPEEIFDGLRMDPSTTSDRLPDGCFNTWRGLAVEPSESGSCHLFRQHLLQNVCGGRQALADYVWRWMAHLAQRPATKPLVALLLYGEAQGTGKDFVGRTLGRLLRPVNYQHVRSAYQLLDNYNGRLLVNSLLIHAEEILVESPRKGLDQLKSLITAPRVKIRFMRADAYDVDSYTRFLLTSNHAAPIHIEPSDRRFFAIEVPQHPHTNSREWFAAAEAELAAGGLQRLLYELQHEPLDDFAPIERPHTAEHDTLRSTAILPLHDYVAGILESGNLQDIPCDDFRLEFAKWCNLYKIDAPYTSIGLGMALGKIGMIRSRRQKHPRHRYYDLQQSAPALRENLIRLYPDLKL